MRQVPRFSFLVSNLMGKLRKRCFLYVSGREMFGISAQIFTNNDGKFTGFVGLI